MESSTEYPAYVRDAAGSTFYHSVEWLGLIREAYGFEPHHLIVEEEGRIRGALPLFLVRSWIKGKNLISVPFSHSVPLLYDDRTFGEALVQGVLELGRQLGVGYVEIKGAVEPELLGSRFVARIEGNHVSKVTLEGSIDTIWKKLDGGSTRWGVGRARRSGVTVREGTDPEDFQAFYELEAETRRRQGVPLYPRRLFQGLRERLVERGLARLLLAEAGGACIGGVVVFYHKDEVIYGYSATRADQASRRLQPTNLLLWTSIEEAHSEGYRLFNLGSTPLHNKGLFDFKRRWGAESALLTYSYLLLRGTAPTVIDRESRSIEVARRLLRRCPLGLSKLVGPFLIRHVA